MSWRVVIPWYCYQKLGATFDWGCIHCNSSWLIVTWLPLMESGKCSCFPYQSLRILLLKIYDFLVLFFLFTVSPATTLSAPWHLEFTCHLRLKQKEPSYLFFTTSQVRTGKCTCCGLGKRLMMRWNFHPRVLIWIVFFFCCMPLKGLTCTEQNVVTKSGFQRYAAEHGLVVVCPDTSPSKTTLFSLLVKYGLDLEKGFSVLCNVMYPLVITIIRFSK